MQILVVCAANRARSPAAAQLLRVAASCRQRRGEVWVHSAGLTAADGEEMLPDMRRALIRRHFAVEEHRSRRVELGDALASDLVITMTEHQRRELSRLAPTIVSRCYTLREMARLVTSPRWSVEWNGAADVVARLQSIRPLVPPAPDAEDIEDPTRGPRLARSVLDRIERSVDLIADPLFGEKVS